MDDSKYRIVKLKQYAYVYELQKRGLLWGWNKVESTGARSFEEAYTKLLGDELVRYYKD